MNFATTIDDNLLLCMNLVILIIIIIIEGNSNAYENNKMQITT